MNNINIRNTMKNLIRRKAICLYLVLVSFLLASCESDQPVVPPYIVRIAKYNDGDGGKYIYKLNSIKKSNRYIWIITDAQYKLGEVLEFSVKKSLFITTEDTIRFKVSK